MISFFRRALSSWIILGLLGLVLVAFIITGVNGPTMGGTSSGGATIAKVGGSRISTRELITRVQNQFEAARRDNPGLDQKSFLAAGAFESIADALISARALESWGREQGFAIGKRLVDAQIAQIPAFRGVTGQFDAEMMRARLAQARINERAFRDDLASDLLRDQILAPASAEAPAPAIFAKPYAKLLLEERRGSVAILPFAMLAEPTVPTDAQIAAAYKANIAAYTRPEARVLRYATFGLPQVAEAATPTEAEIARYYQENAASYAAKELRDFTQVITPDAALARSIAASAKAGVALSNAASKAGLEASRLPGQTQSGYAGSTSAAIAGQAFSAARGSVLGPIKGAFGWYVVKVDGVSGTPARSLQQVRPEIIAILTKQKAQDALSDLAAKIEGSIDDGASLAEIVANNKLTLVYTPPILASGQAVDQPSWKAPAELQALLKTGFEAGADEAPTVETVMKDQSYALLSVAKIIPPTPLPLAQVHDSVVRDLMKKRAADRAQMVAAGIAAAVNRGVPLAKAMTDSGVRLPPAKPARARQLDLARAQQSGQPVPAAVRELFQLKPGKAKAVPGETGDVLFVVALDAVVPGDLTTMPGLLDSAKAELSRSIGGELREQFTRSVERDVKIERHPEAISAAKRQFSGGL